MCMDNACVGGGGGGGEGERKSTYVGPPPSTKV